MKKAAVFLGVFVISIILTAVTENGLMMIPAFVFVVVADFMGWFSIKSQSSTESKSGGPPHSHGVPDVRESSSVGEPYNPTERTQPDYSNGPLMKLFLVVCLLVSAYFTILFLGAIFV